MIKHLQRLSQTFKGARIIMEVEPDSLTEILALKLPFIYGATPDGKDAVNFTLNSTEFTIKKK